MLAKSNQVPLILLSMLSKTLVIKSVVLFGMRQLFPLPQKYVANNLCVGILRRTDANMTQQMEREAG